MAFTIRHPLLPLILAIEIRSFSSLTGPTFNANLLNLFTFSVRALILIIFQDLLIVLCHMGADLMELNQEQVKRGDLEHFKFNGLKPWEEEKFWMDFKIFNPWFVLSSIKFMFAS